MDVLMWGGSVGLRWSSLRKAMVYLLRFKASILALPARNSLAKSVSAYWPKRVARGSTVIGVPYAWLKCTRWWRYRASSISSLTTTLQKLTMSMRRGGDGR
eukprot:6296549-Ditylum_brightwellii.AAC.1